MDRGLYTKVAVVDIKVVDITHSLSYCLDKLQSSEMNRILFKYQCNR